MFVEELFLPSCTRFVVLGKKIQLSNYESLGSKLMVEWQSRLVTYGILRLLHSITGCKAVIVPSNNYRNEALSEFPVTGGT